MGLLVDGVWQDDVSRTKDGHFIRPATQLPQLGHAGRQPRPFRRRRLYGRGAGRYHLYVSLACPWAHRTMIFRKLKALENVISLSIVSPDMGKDGWTFNSREGSTGDSVNGKSKLSEIYRARRSALLRPRQRAGAVGQEAQDHRQQRVPRNHPHAQFGVRRLHQCAHRLLSRSICAPRSTASTTLVYPNINNGVYRAGFATSQAAYELAFRDVFDTLDEIEQILSRQRYLAGQHASPRPTGGCSAR